MAGAAHSQQEAQRDSRPSLSLHDPEEEGPSGLRASVWPWSPWARLGHLPASVLPTLASPWKPLELPRSLKSTAGGWGPEPGVVG